MDARVVEQGRPRLCQAGRISHCPARTRQCLLLRLGAVKQGRLQQGCLPADPKCGPARTGLYICVVFVGNERQAAGDCRLSPEPPIVFRERIVTLVEKQDFCCVLAQKARFERGLVPPGGIKTVETQCGVMSVEGVIVRARPSLIVSDEPELALRILAREMLDALPKHGLFRRP
ncbi:MAG: hypothetical protein OXF88_16905 [Rhodobacteraceae bacterium]|nr:hypothetical protein [Paracoccaceae bacterium]